MANTTLVILNAHAGDKDHDQIKEALARRGFRLVEISHPGEGTEIARREASRGTPMILAGGGDGTVWEVASGVLTADKPATLGILPLGTGNDLCRSLDINADLEDALHIIDIGRTADIDVGMLTAAREKQFFFNVSACGFAGNVDKQLKNTDKTKWGMLSYLKSGIAALSELEPFRADIRAEEEMIDVQALNIVVGNGRYAASGIPVAARASLTDGKLDMVVYLGQGLSDQIFNSRLIIQGEQGHSETILSLRSTQFALKFSRPLAINYDGELFEREVEEVSYTVYPQRLRVIVGQNFTSQD
jgi:diacylglycerol kinase (ATP)